MGLDGVELALKTEERFGIQITDAEAEHVRTPGMLVDLVYSKVKKGSDRYCRSHRAFHILRRTVIDEFGVARSAVRLDAKLSALGISGSPNYWPRMHTAVKAISWPTLEYPLHIEAFRSAFVLTILAAGLLSSYWTMVNATPPLIQVAACVGFLAALVIANKSAKFFDYLAAKHRTELPQDALTVRDLIRYVESSAEITWTRESIACEIRNIVIDTLCIEPEIYGEDADFVKDLGLS
jgi:acyl carrier protein